MDIANAMHTASHTMLGVTWCCSECFVPTSKPQVILLHIIVQLFALRASSRFKRHKHSVMVLNESLEREPTPLWQTCKALHPYVGALSRDYGISFHGTVKQWWCAMQMHNQLSSCVFTLLSLWYWLFAACSDKPHLLISFVHLTYQYFVPTKETLCTKLSFYLFMREL